MQIYADIANRPMKISKSDQTPALGAAMFSAVAAGKDGGGYNSIEEAQKFMTGTTNVFNPIQENVDVYKKLYRLYKQVHDAFGTKEWNGSMYNIMKELLDIRDEVRRSK